jgi:hypothetical protein
MMCPIGLSRGLSVGGDRQVAPAGEFLRDESVLGLDSPNGIAAERHA